MAGKSDDRVRPGARFHGRVEGATRACDHDGCRETGEFRAPPAEGSGGGFDGPGQWRWYCLDHVRAFNAGYNFFSGMSSDEIAEAQSPLNGWERETRAFASSGADRAPNWTNFTDPLEAISGRFRRTMPQDRKDGRPLSGQDRQALKVLGLEVDADRRILRQRYADLVRRYHPDRNGGDRSHEKALQDVIAAYTQLKGAVAFA